MTKLQSPLPRQSFLHFLIGGISGAIATTIVQPIDTLKVQTQVVSQQRGKILLNKNFSMAADFRKICGDKGVFVLYRGLESAIWRQLFYASARLGSYTWAVQKLKSNGKKISLFDKIGLSAFSGVFGALIGNPFDLALIRRQASVSTGKNAYKNTFQAFSSIIKQQGILKLWRGADITMIKVLTVNIGQLAGNEMITDFITPYFRQKTELVLNVSAILAAVLTAFISLPVDNLKVKLQKQTSDNIIYKGIGDCLSKTMQREGYQRLWVGFSMYLTRSLPHSFVLIRTQQYLKKKLLNVQ